MKKFILLFFAISAFVPSFPCTTFFINKNGQLIFGRNYDWMTGNGMVCSNQKGLSKTSSKTPDGNTISWISKYGSITFNQYGKEFPTGGMNEKGLVVEMMWLDGTQYPAADARPAIGELQWLQYQLDNCSTVAELIATDKDIRIASKGTAPLHFLTADATGNVATIEFINGKMLVHNNNNLPFPVLTNNSYEESLPVAKLTNPVVENSLERFNQTCSMVQTYQANTINIPVVDYSFNILNKVAQTGYTKWSIVYDISNKKIYFKTAGYPSIKNISFSAFNFTCAAPSKAWDMNQIGNGDISNQFINFNQDLNQHIAEKSFAESASQINATEQEIKDTWTYPAGIFCKKE